MPEFSALRLVDHDTHAAEQGRRFVAAEVRQHAGRYEGFANEMPGPRPALESLSKAPTALPFTNDRTPFVEAQFARIMLRVDGIPESFRLLDARDEPVLARHRLPGASPFVHQRQALLELLATRTFAPDDAVPKSLRTIESMLVALTSETRSLPPSQQASVMVRIIAAAHRFDEVRGKYSLVDALADDLHGSPLQEGEVGRWLPPFIRLASLTDTPLHEKAVREWHDLFLHLGASDPGHDRSWMLRLPLMLSQLPSDEGPLGAVVLSMAQELTHDELRSLDAPELSRLLEAAIASTAAEEELERFRRWFGVVDRTSHGAAVVGGALDILSTWHEPGDLPDPFDLFPRAGQLVRLATDPQQRAELAEKMVDLACDIDPDEHVHERFVLACELAAELSPSRFHEDREGRDSLSRRLSRLPRQLPLHLQQDAIRRVRAVIKLLDGARRNASIGAR